MLSEITGYRSLNMVGSTMQMRRHLDVQSPGTKTLAFVMEDVVTRACGEFYTVRAFILEASPTQISKTPLETVRDLSRVTLLMQMKVDECEARQRMDWEREQWQAQS